MHLTLRTGRISLIPGLNFKVGRASRPSRKDGRDAHPTLGEVSAELSFATCAGAVSPNGRLGDATLPGLRGRRDLLKIVV